MNNWATAAVNATTASLQILTDVCTCALGTYRMILYYKRGYDRFFHISLTSSPFQATQCKQHRQVKSTRKNILKRNKTARLRLGLDTLKIKFCTLKVHFNTFLQHLSLSAFRAFRVFPQQYFRTIVNSLNSSNNT